MIQLDSSRMAKDTSIHQCKAHSTRLVSLVFTALRQTVTHNPQERPQLWCLNSHTGTYILRSQWSQCVPLLSFHNKRQNTWHSHHPTSSIYSSKELETTKFRTTNTTLQKQMRPRTIQSWVGATKWGQSGHRAHGLAILSEGNLSQMESVALQCVNAHNQTVLEISYKWVKHTKYNNLMQVAASLLWISLSSHIQCKYVSLLLLFPPCLSICISVDLSKYTRYIYSILMEWILWDSCDLLTCLFFSSHVLLLWFVLFSFKVVVVVCSLMFFAVFVSCFVFSGHFWDVICSLE